MFFWWKETRTSMDNIASNNTNMPSSGLAVQQETQPRSSLFPLYNTISRTTRMDSFLMGWRLDRSRIMSATATGTQNPTVYHPFREMKPCLAIVPYIGLHRHVNMNSQRQHCDWLPLLYGKRLINLNDTPSLPRFGLSGALRPEVLVEIRCSTNYFKEITVLVKVLALNVTVGLSQNELLARFKTSKLTRWNTFPALVYGDSRCGETNTDMVRTELEKICSKNETIVEIKRSTKTTKPHNLSLIDNADKALSRRRGLPPSTGFKKWRKSKSRIQKPRKAKRIPSSSFHSSRNINMKRPVSIPSMVSPQDLQHQPPNKIFVSISGIVRRHATYRAIVQLEQYPSAGRRLLVQTIVKEDDLCAMFNESLANIFKKDEDRNGTDMKEEKRCENCRLKPHRVKSPLNVKAMDDCCTAPRGGQDHDGSCDQRKSLEAVSSLATLQRMFSGDAIHALLQMLRPPPMSLKDYQKALQRIKVDINVLRRKFRKKIRKIQRIVRKRPFTSSSFSACSTTETNHPPNKIFVSGNGIFPRYNTSEFNGFGEDSTVSENDIDKLCTLFEACSTTTDGNSKEIGRN